MRSSYSKSEEDFFQFVNTLQFPPQQELNSKEKAFLAFIDQTKHPDLERLVRSGWKQYELKDYNIAISYFSKAIELNQTYFEAYYGRALVKYQLRDFDAALNDLTEAIKLNANEIKLYSLRAEIYKSQGKIQQAEADEKRIIAIERGNSPEAQLYQALKNANYELTLKNLENFRRQYPHKPPVTLLPDGDEQNALLTLAHFGYTGYLKIFLKYIKLSVTDAAGNTSLHIAAAYGYQSFFSELLEYGIIHATGIHGYQWPVNQAGETPLHCAAKEGRIDFIKFLATTYSVDITQSTSSKSDTIVHLLIQRQQVKALQRLLTAYPRFPLNVKNAVGLDAFLLAVELEQKEILNILKNYDIDLHSQGPRKESALHIATKKGHSREFIEFLIEDLQVPTELLDEQNLSARDYVIPDSDTDVYLENQSKRLKAALAPSFKMTHRDFRYLVFKGGGVKGMVYPSALRKLIEEKVVDLPKIEAVGGSSAGAIMALILGLGYTLNEIEHLMGVTSFSQCDLPQLKFKELLDGEWGGKLLALINQDWNIAIGKTAAETLKRLQGIDGWLSGIARMLDGTVANSFYHAQDIVKKIQLVGAKIKNDLGLCPGDKLENLFDMLIQRKVKEKTGDCHSKNITFKDLAEYSDFKKMYFTGLNTHTGECEIFSVEHTPDMLVANAVRISMAIPGVFTPKPKIIRRPDGSLEIGKIYYVDGGVTRNFPIDLFDFGRYCHIASNSNLPEINHRTLGFSLYSSNNTPVPTADNLVKNNESSGKIQEIFTHFKGVLSAIYNQQDNEQIKNRDKHRTVVINTDVDTLDFDKVEQYDVKSRLITQGKKAAETFIKERKMSHAMDITLPKDLHILVLSHTENNVLSTTASNGLAKEHIKIRKNCPDLVMAFYEYKNTALQDYLHTTLGVSLWARDDRGDTAFHYAAKVSNKEALQRLLSVNKAGATVVNHLQQTPLTLARQTGNSEIIELLESIEAKTIITSCSPRPSANSSSHTHSVALVHSVFFQPSPSFSHPNNLLTTAQEEKNEYDETLLNLNYQG